MSNPTTWKPPTFGLVKPVRSSRALSTVKKLSTYDPRQHGAECDKCPLNGLPVVPPTIPEGVPDAILVGEGPGAEEVFSKTPFVGPSGRKVNKLLAKNGLHRDRMFITNATLCRFRSDEDKPKALKCCEPRLRREIDSQPKSVPVIPLGAHAFKSVYGRKIAITLARGFVWEKDGRTILPTIHPAFVLRDHVQSPLFNRDFRRIGDFIQGRLKLDRPKGLSVPRTLPELQRLLKRFGPLVACDIETTEEPPTVCDLLCIGISDVKTTIVVPWNTFFQKALNDFFKTRTTIFHNGFAFDSIVMKRFGIDVPKIEDTLIAHHVYASHFPQRLDHLVSFYLDAEPWKIQFGKRGGSEKGAPKKAIDEEQLHFYNSLDVYLTARLWQEMKTDLAPWQKLYREDKEQAELCRDMQCNGVLVDVELKNRLSVAIKEKEERLFSEMVALNGGEEFSPSKVRDIRRILFEKFKAPILERTPTGLPKTSKSTLQAFAGQKDRPYAEFSRKLVTLRACAKMRVTYLDNLPVESDGRVRASWRSFGTPTGRFACVAKGTLIEIVRDVHEYPKGVPIEKVRPGDLAYSYTDAGKLVIRKVLAAECTGHNRKVLRVHWTGTGQHSSGYLDLTPEHEVRLTDGRWVQAKDLKDKKRQLFGITAYAKDCALNYRIATRIEQLDKTVDVYNLEIEETHNFIANELCVHNCRKPNLTNLRRQENNEPEQQIRTIYIAPRGHKLVGFDLSQVEPRIASYISGDDKMVESIISGDFHTANARILFGDLPELLDSHEAKHGKGKNLRMIAKTSGLAVQYLAGADKLFETIRTSPSTANFPVSYRQVVVMLERLHKAYKGHFDRCERDLDTCRKQGFLKIGFMSGRVRWLGHAPSPSDAANSPIQAGAADVMNDLLLRIWKRVRRVFKGRVKLIAQIHDAGIFEVPDALVDAVKKIIQEEADKPVTVNGYTAVFPIDLKSGTRWSEV